MHNLTVIRYQTQTSPSRALAERIHERCIYGRIAVVAHNPSSLLSSTRKQMVSLTKRLERERASILDGRKKSELTQDIVWAQRLRFSSKVPEDLLEADVTFGKPADFARFAPICSTIFITSYPNKEQLYMMTSWVTRGGVVYIYEGG